MQVRVQFSIFLINKPGVLASVSGALAKKRVNLVALTVMDSMEHGVLRIVCDDPVKARAVLGKAHDQWTETEVLVIELGNEAGAFAKVAQVLADAHVNISYAYCTGGAGGGRTTAVFKVADLKKAKKLLSVKKAKARRSSARATKSAPRKRNR